jgi:hypothetical protein
MLELDPALFRNADPHASAAAFLDLAQHHGFQLGHDAIIVTDTHDVIDLRNTDLQKLTAADFVAGPQIGATVPAVTSVAATGADIPSMALLANYMAGSFVASSDGGGALIHDRPLEPQSLVANPHG